MLKQMNENDMRQYNGGGYHCDYCNWATWGKSAMKSHQRAKHGAGHWWKPYCYHFHWSLPTNCYTSCSNS